MINRCYNMSLKSIWALTGTGIQPDIITYFVKSKGEPDFQYCHTRPAINWAGYCFGPCFFTGSVRIFNAVKGIFKELSQQRGRLEFGTDSRLWNLFKNLFRGIAELIPFTGIFLIIYDTIRCQTHVASIDRQLADERDISGVAADGRVAIIIENSHIDHANVHFADYVFETTQQKLQIWSQYCTFVLNEAMKNAFLRNTQMQMIFALIHETI